MDPTAPVDVIHVRPGKAALDLLVKQTADLKQGDPFARVAIVVPGYFAARAIRLHLGQSGGVVNVEIVLMAGLATEIVGDRRQGRPTLTAALEEAAVREAVRSHGGHFAGLAHHASLHRALMQLNREMRKNQIEVSHEGFQRGATAQSAAACYTSFRRITSGYDDFFQIREFVTDIVSDRTQCPPFLADLKGIIVWYPAEIPGVEARMLAALGHRCPVRIVLPNVEKGKSLLENIHEKLGVDVVGSDAEGNRELNDAPLTNAELRVLRAPDAMEEAREVARRIAADLENGIPLHRIAVLFRSMQSGTLMQEVLNRAEMPFVALQGKPLQDTRPGRCLTALLRIQEDDFTVSSVLSWVELRPATEVVVSVATWSRLAREARIINNARQWRERLIALAEVSDVNDVDLRARDRDGAADRAQESADGARAMANVIDHLAEVLGPPIALNWHAWLAWVDSLVQLCASPDYNWQPDDRESYQDMRNVLKSLGAIATLIPDETVTFGLFASTVRGALRSRSRPVGTFGESIVVGSIHASTGLAFDRVYVIGMIEGAFPPPPPIDPFFVEQSKSPTKSREKHGARERLAFLSALAAADGGRLTLCASDASGGKAAFPSQWLLDVIRQRLGLKSFGQGDFLKLNHLEHGDWFRVIASPVDGVRGLVPIANQSSPEVVSAADVEDRRLAAVVDWVIGRRRRLTDHALAVRQDIHLGRGLRASSERRGISLTAFDGNVDDRGRASSKGSRRLVDAFGSGRPISPSALEEWATCPFRFFMNRVLKVLPTEEVREMDSIDPMTRGSLIHEVASTYYRKRIGKAPAADAEAIAAIHECAGALVDGLGPQTALGHPLVWENTRAVMWADLPRLLRQDVQLAAEGTTIANVEQAFGLEEAGSWPPLTIHIDGRTIAFRGRIDRVDRTPSGALVIDYKTGKDFSNDTAFKEDPFSAGEHLQVAIYALAVRTFAKLENVAGAYWFASSAAAFKRRVIVATSSENVERTHRLLGDILKGIEEGIFPQVSGPESQKSFANCGYCDYQEICPSDRFALWGRKQADSRTAMHAGLKKSAEIGADDDD